MNNKCKFSSVTKNYLSEYRCILDRMISGMTDEPLTESISYNFIIQMIPHHIAAIEMSENILRYTDSLKVEHIAKSIISEQRKSIEDMRTIKCMCGDLTNCENSLCSYRDGMNNIMCSMFTRMNNAPASNSVNCNFLREMIPHHMGAVKMSELTLGFDICEELKPILCSIIKNQKKGISEMNMLLRCMC